MLVRSRVMLDNHLRGILKAFGLKAREVDPGRLDSACSNWSKAPRFSNDWMAPSSRSSVLQPFKEA
jgi:hypothetical protein